MRPARRRFRERAKEVWFPLFAHGIAGHVALTTWGDDQGWSVVRISAIDAHRPPDELLVWDGSVPVVGGVRRRLGAEGLRR